MTALTPERIAELRAIYEPLDRGATHWVGCETEHARCAMYRALDTVEALRAALGRIEHATADVRKSCMGEPDTFVERAAVDAYHEAVEALAGVKR